MLTYLFVVLLHVFQQEQVVRLGHVSNLTPTIDKYAPLYFVRGDAAPMLIISGDRELELFGRYEENAYFVRMLRLNGHKKVTFYEVDGFDHGDMAQPAHLLLLKYMKKNNK